MADLGFGFEVRLKDSFSRTAKRVTGLTGKMSKGFGRVRGSVRKLSAAIPGMAKGLGAVGVAYAGIVKPIKEYGEFAERTVEYSNLIAASGKSAAEVDKATNEMMINSRKLAIETGLKAVDINKGYWAAASASVNAYTDEIHDTMRTVARGSRAFSIDQKTAIDFVTLAWTGYSREVGTAKDLIGRINIGQRYSKGGGEDVAVNIKKALPMLALMNIGLDESIASFATLTHVAETPEVAGTLLMNMAKNIMTPAPQVTRRYQELELDMSRAAIKGRGLLGTLKYLNQAAIDNQFGKVGLKLHTLGLEFPAMAMHGKNMTTSAAFILQQMESLKPEQFDKISSSFKRLGINLDRDGWEAKTLKERFDTIFNALKAGGPGVEQFFPNVRSARGAIGMLSDAIKFYHGVMRDAPGATKEFDKAYAKSLKTPFARMQILQERLREIQLKIGEKLLKPGGVGDRFLKWAEGADFNGMVDAVSKVVGQIRGLVEYAVGKFLGPGPVAAILNSFKTLGDKATERGRKVLGTKEPDVGIAPGARLAAGEAGIVGILKGIMAGWKVGSPFGLVGRAVGAVAGGFVGERIASFIPGVEVAAAEAVRQEFPKQVALIRAMIGLENLDRALGVGPPKTIATRREERVPVTGVQRRPDLLGDFGEQIRQQRADATAREQQRDQNIQGEFSALFTMVQKFIKNPPPVQVLLPDGRVLFETIRAQGELEGSRT